MPTPDVFKAEARARRLAALLRELWDECDTAYNCDECSHYSDECAYSCYYEERLKALGVVE